MPRRDASASSVSVALPLAKVTPRSYVYNAHITGEQSARETQERLLAEARRDARTIEPVMLEDVRRAVGIEAGSASRIGPGK